MNKSDLKSIVKEIVSQCIQEINPEKTRGGKSIMAVGAPGSAKRNMAIADPTREEMLKFLQSQFGSEEGWQDEAEVAMYWFANFNHGGQSSNLYSVLSTSPFSPGPIARGPQPESMEEDMFNALEQEYGQGAHNHGDTDTFQEGVTYEIPCPKCGEAETTIDNPSNPAIYTCNKCGHRWNPDNVKQSKGWYVCAVGYPGMSRGSSPKYAVCQDYTSKYLTADGEWDKPMFAKTFWGRDEAEAFAQEKLGAVKEMTTTGAVQGYMTPRAFKKKIKEVDWHDEQSYMQSHGDTHNPADEPPVEHFLNGQSNQVAAKRVNKLLSVLSKGIFSDESWQAINNIFSKLKEAGIEVDLLKTAYGGHKDSQTGMPTFKQWDISIPFTNNKGKQVELIGQITAHGAGTTEDPLQRYDITAYVTPVAKKMDEEEQPEMYDAETDTFAPGPRQRPEDWTQGGDKPKEVPINERTPDRIIRLKSLIPRS